MSERPPLSPGYTSINDWVESSGGVAVPPYPGLLDRQQWDEYNRLLDNKFFLVRNRGGDAGERFRCGRHPYTPGIDEPVYHEFFTVMCIDRPWRGLDGALYAYASVTSDGRLQSMVLRDLPALQTRHPGSFSHLAPDSAGEDLIAIALGTLEPISELKAQQLAAKINAARPPRPFIL